MVDPLVPWGPVESVELVAPLVPWGPVESVELVEPSVPWGPAMIGQVVEHAHFGRGQIVAIYRGGAEWLVRFESGLRFRRPRQEFGGRPDGPAAQPLPAFRPPPPMPPSQFQARRLVDALRVGIAPPGHVRELTIGLEAERASLADGLNRALEEGGAVRAVVGEYGFGKSHFVQLTAEEALARRFLVATTGLDTVELPAHRPFVVWAALMRALRYPDRDERGLAALLDATASPRFSDPLRSQAPVADDPLVVGLEAMAGSASQRGRRPWQHWLMGERKVKGMAKALPRGTRMPTIYTTGSNERQLAYLLCAVSALARLAGYSGLAVLIDEAETASLLRPAQRDKADLFFSTLVYAALGQRQSRIDPATFPEHRYRDYPPRYGRGQSLFFLFTLTHSDFRMPIEDWLDPDQILALDPRPSPPEIGQFVGRVEAYHAAAFGYELAERHGQVRRAATEILAGGVRQGRLGIRGIVRLVMELYDLVFLYPDYDIPTLLDELRRQLR